MPVVERARYCNDYRLKVVASAILRDFADPRIRIPLLRGRAEHQARNDIKITDTSPIVRTRWTAIEAPADLVPTTRELAWTEPPKPVYFGSEGREFASGPLSYTRGRLL
jgi:hypothetical protein